MDIPRVLFIDAEHSVLNSLRRSLRKNYREWDIRYLTNAHEARRAIEFFDPWIVVSERFLPGDTQVQLLDLVAEYCPSAVRILLSSGMSQASALSSVTNAHLMIPKPYELSFICKALDRAYCLRTLPISDGLRSCLGGLKSLPALPNTYTLLSEELQKEEPSILVIAEIVDSDPAILTKLLQLANSAYFGSGVKIHRAHEAVMRLGIELIQGLVLVVGLFNHSEDMHESEYSELLAESFAVAELSAKLAEKLGYQRNQVELAYLSGLLHNLGHLLVLECELPVGQEQHAADEVDPFSVTGAYLLKLWSFEHEVVEAVLYHQTPQKFARADIVVTCVYVASSLFKAWRQNTDPLETLDFSYLKKFHISATIIEELSGEAS